MLGTFPTVRLHGDKEAAKMFYGYAMQQLEVLLRLMSFNNIKVDRRQVQLDSGGYIRIYVNYDYKQIDIFYPPTYVEVKKERRPWEPWEGSKEIACIDHRWESGMMCSTTLGTGRIGWGIVTGPGGGNDSPTVTIDWDGSDVGDFRWAECDFTGTWTNFKGADHLNDHEPTLGYPCGSVSRNDLIDETMFPYASNYYWLDIYGGKLEYNIFPKPGWVDWTGCSVFRASGYTTHYTLWTRQFDTVQPMTNAGAGFIELSALTWLDHAPGWGLGELPPVAYYSYVSFIARDVNGNWFVWYLMIDYWYYNDVAHAQAPNNTAFIGDTEYGFSGGTTGAPIQLNLAEYGFDSDIIMCGFVTETFLQSHYDMNGVMQNSGRNLMMSCDYIDFY